MSDSGGGVAETSGFATDLAQSANLVQTMRRAISAAQQRSHRYVTLEHLLLALMEDADTRTLLGSLRVDIRAVKTDITDTVNRNLATLYTPGEFDLRASYKVERVLQTASDDARRLNCVEVDGAFVLAALAREVDSPAAEIVKHSGFAFSSAVSWLYTNRGSRSDVAPVSREAPRPQMYPRETSPQPQMREPQTREPQMHEPQMREPQMRAVEPQAQEPQLREPRMREPQMREQPPKLEREHPIELQRVTASPQPVAEMDDEPLELEIIVEDDDVELEREVVELAPVHTYTHEDRRPVREEPTPAPQMREFAPRHIATQSEEATPYTTVVLASRTQQETDFQSEEFEEEASSPYVAPRPEPSVSYRPEPPSSATRQEVPIARLEEMRLRSAPPPAPPPTSAKPLRKKGAALRNETQPLSWRERDLEAQLEKMLASIPPRMRAGSAGIVEIFVSREETEAFTRNLDSQGELMRHELLVMSALTVMLRAPEGDFTVEPITPETQWILEGVERPEDETYGRWAWKVTPKHKGEGELQLLTGARSVDLSGLVGETDVPAQTVSVRVRGSVWQILKRLPEWLFVMAVGGAVTQIGLKLFQSFTQ